MKADVHTIKEEYVSVDDRHELYTQLWGNPESQNRFLFLHGGPGSGTKDRSKMFFDPQQDLVLFFDQRGCGVSTPMGELRDNTTKDLVQDIEALRAKHDWDSVTLVGNSWGSCLGLAYALERPKHVGRMVIGGIFTGRRSEIDFIDAGHVQSHFPDAWQHYAASVPSNYRDSPSSYHFARILGENYLEAIESTQAYTMLEDGVSSLTSDPQSHAPGSISKADWLSTRIEVHYLTQDCFLPDGYILDNAHELTMPIDIIQGRYDMVCPPQTAYTLSTLAINATLTFTNAGHSMSDPENTARFKQAISASRS